MSRIDDAAFWARLRLAFDEIVAHDDAGRAARLDEIGAADAVLRAELERLLEADTSAADQLGRIDRVFDIGARGPDPVGLTGRVVGHFHVIAPLATGGMGVVYRALDTNLERTVALKFPLPYQRPDARIAERFRREARAAAALDHPNICSVYEAGQTEDGQLFLAMALYDGETLKARLAREGSLPIQDAVDVGAQLARGLDAAHRAGIVHRDLKPANLMLLPDGCVKILDFGLARMTDATLTKARSTPGTVAYMAPELVRGEVGDVHSDLWALGVLLYEMVAGERPFQHQHDVAQMHAILHNEPVRPSLLRPGIEPRLEQLILSLLAKDPNARPETASRVLGVLESPKGNRSVHATSAAPPRRHARRAMAVGAAIALTLLGLSAWLLRPDNGRDTGPAIVAVMPFDAVDDDPDATAIGVALADAVSMRLSELVSVTSPGFRFVKLYSVAGSDAERFSGIPGADGVVTGTVERSGGNLRVTIELYDARRRRSSTHTYTFTRADLHTSLPRLLNAIASGLRLDLTREDRTRLAALPTTSPEAWELHLRGRAVRIHQDVVAVGVTEKSMQQAQAYYARAVALDPDFALARAHLAQVHLNAARTYDTTLHRREQARLEAEAAVRLDPALSEAHTALMSYYRQQGDQERVDAQYQLAIAAAPNRASLRPGHAFRLSTLGRWKEAGDELALALRLDPRNPQALGEAAVTYSRLRRYEDGIAAWNRVLTLDSGFVQGKLIRGYVYLGLGIIDSLAATVERIPPEQDNDGMRTWARYTVLRVQRRHADALAMLDSTRHTGIGDVLFYRPITLMRALTLDEMGESARPEYEAARALLEDSIRVRPRDARYRIALGLAYAGLGRSTDAVAEARTAMEISPLTTSTHIATAFMGGAVEVFIKAGEHEDAIRLIELLLAMPAGREVSVPRLRLDPTYDPLRGDPRFEQLLVRFSRS